MKYANLARGAALGATVLIAACSGTSNAPSAPATHPPLGSQPPQQIVIKNASDEPIVPEVEAAPCWMIKPPFPTVAGDTESPPVEVAAIFCSDPGSRMLVSYAHESELCKLEVMATVSGASNLVTYIYLVQQGIGTNCTASRTAYGELFTFALKS